MNEKDMAFRDCFSDEFVNPDQSGFVLAEERSGHGVLDEVGLDLNRQQSRIIFRIPAFRLHDFDSPLPR